MSESQPNQKDELQLVPKRPPGRSSRKARAFAAQIGRLYAQGYTLEAIREALADAGVTVSKSTVQREAVRQAALRSAAATLGAAALAGQAPERRQAQAVIEPPAACGGPSAQISGRSGTEIAEEFMKDRVDNPLIRGRSNS